MYYKFRFQSYRSFYNAADYMCILPEERNNLRNQTTIKTKIIAGSIVNITATFYPLNSSRELNNRYH
jgi:hypothetical protein